MRYFLNVYTSDETNNLIQKCNQDIGSVSRILNGPLITKVLTIEWKKKKIIFLGGCISRRATQITELMIKKSEVLNQVWTETVLKNFDNA
jgi:hypothetical protein